MPVLTLSQGKEVARTALVASRAALVFACAGVCMLVTGCSEMLRPLGDAQIGTFATEVTGSLARTSPPFSGTLDVESAVGRAITYNREIETARYAAAVELAQLRVERGELLPDVVGESEYYRRSKRQYSRSNRSIDYASSSDLASLTHNIDLSLNLLDFGLTLIRMRQAADKANIKGEEARRVALRIAQDTRAVYWRAVGLQTLVPALSKITPQVNEALQLSQRAVQDTALDPVNFINFQRDLLNTRRELNDVFAQLAGAEYQLKNLANIEAVGPLSLDSRRNLSSLPLPNTTAAEDIATALRLRPEIRQHFYEMRITQEEVHASILKVLPGATLTESFRSESNSYLLYGNWLSVSGRLVANLMEAVRLPGQLDAVDAQQDLNRSNTLVTASAIAMQVCVARAQLSVEMSIYRDADEFARAQKALLKQVRSSVLAGKLPEQMIAREELAALLAQVRAIVAFGDLEAAYASYQSAIGISDGGHLSALNE